MEAKLTGTKAILGLILISLFSGYQYVTATTTINTEGQQVIQEWIASEYQRYQLARSDISQEQKAELLLATQTINFVSMSARGKVPEIVVRVEVAPHESQPPGQELVRYFRLTHSSVTGWQHKSDTSALAYHLAMF